ncbi:NAD(P)/FAD-dependent oxidoreductase [Mycobacterium sp. Y57]|uniref:phytoene desaturase family protein n=1 Tax=Mycolicibacterium xanthum TaxID=2796469 RepID=UPI001C85481D|nr:NAD(P)/FAD-dependent oxidoreductase [Mycolicibacterium xanthum]MBX7434184.1 NAD(P)/FAD-dependent oxidoreductase [Mycolicibacterium xanthum]
MVERVDAVVVGAGLGGLAAAVTLAGAGKRTVVLEQHSVAGGYASSFQRGPYRFDTALHELSGLAPGGGSDALYRQLGIWHRLRPNRLDPLYVLRGPGRQIVAHADAFAYEAELIRHFPGQADQIRAYLDDAMAVYRDVRRLTTDRATGHDPSPDKMVGRYPAMVQASGETWDQMMARHVTDPQLRAVLGAFWVYLGLPPSQCAALLGGVVTGTYHQHGGWYPEGGAQAISAALADVLHEHGGEIRCGQPVTGLDVEGDRVLAVTTDQGLRLEADVFVSNASALTTALELVGREHLPVEYVERIEKPAPSYTTFSVYLGLDRDNLGEQEAAHEWFLNATWDADEAWQAAQSGDWDRVGLSVTDYTHVDPGCAPPGHGVVVLTTVAPWGYQNVWGTGGDLTGYHDNPAYVRVKQEVADALVRRAVDEFPALADSICYREASTPLTNFHYTHNPHGAIEGYENSPANSGLGWLPHHTPMTNLFLAGAWTNSGGMNAAINSGVEAAQQILTRSRTPV